MQGAFEVRWQGYAADGIQGYDVQYAIGGGGMWVDWLSNTSATQAQFGPDDPVSVMPGSAYCFRVRARDWAGHIEPYPVQADTCTAWFDHLIYLPLVVRRH